MSIGHIEKTSNYPWNLLETAQDIGTRVSELCYSIAPDIVVIENTVRGRNRHAQRVLRLDPSLFVN